MQYYADLPNNLYVASDGCTDQARHEANHAYLDGSRSDEARAVETVDITPNFDNLRAWMLRAWADPRESKFRAAIRKDKATLAWLNPPK